MKTRSAVSLISAAALVLPMTAWAQSSAVSVVTPKVVVAPKAASNGHLVVITTPLASGHLQSVSFVPPAGPMTQSQAARWIDLARDDLLARGIDKPTALQITAVLLGGKLTTPDGDVQVPGLLPKAQRKGAHPSQMQVVYSGPYV